MILVVLGSMICYNSCGAVLLVLLQAFLRARGSVITRQKNIETRRLLVVFCTGAVINADWTQRTQTRGENAYDFSILYKETHDTYDTCCGAAVGGPGRKRC